MKARGATSVGGIDGTFGGSLLFLTIARPLLSILAGGGSHMYIVLYFVRIRNSIQGDDDDDDDDDGTQWCWKCGASKHLYKSAMVQRYKGQLQILLVENIRLLMCKTVCKPAFLQDDAVRQVGY